MTDGPELRIEGPASPREAAAISAAVQQFLIETAPAPSTNESGMDPWLKAALVEGVSAKVAFGPGEPFGTD